MQEHSEQKTEKQGFRQALLATSLNFEIDKQSQTTPAIHIIDTYIASVTVSGIARVFKGSN